MKSIFSKEPLFVKNGKMYLKLLWIAVRSSRCRTVLIMGKIYLKRKFSTLGITVSHEFPFLGRKSYFCDEPWVGVFSIETNEDVTFCPCYLGMKIGNLNEAPIREIWNAEPLIQIRRSFEKGLLPRVCQHQLCPVVLDHKL